MGDTGCSEKLKKLLERKSQKEILEKYHLLTPVEKEIWGRKLYAFYSECGCRMSAVFMLSSLALYFSALFFGFISKNIFVKVLFGFLLPISGAIAGKVFGLLVAGYKLRKGLAELAQTIKIREAEGELKELQEDI